MGFIDRVKEAAQDVAVEAKKVSAQAQGKLEETQLKRRMDDHAKQLGYLIHRERTQGVVEGAEAERLVSEITSLELQIAQAAAHARAKQAEATSKTPPEAPPAPAASAGTAGPASQVGAEPPPPPPDPPATGAPPTP
jgi:septal ring factor EnvC (AmiA/AmiB activator)